MVINSNFWEGHFLSGEKKRVPPGGHGLAWLSPASAGKKNGCPKSSQIRDPGRPWQPSQNSQNTKKTLGKQGILENVEILVATEIPRNLKNTGENKVFWSKMNSTWRRKSQKTLQNQCKLGILSKREAGPRASLGQPSAGKKNGCRLAAMARPGSGRPERGKQNGFPKSGHPFFFPAP